MTIVESAFTRLIALSRKMMMNNIAIFTKKIKKESVKQTIMKYIRTKRHGVCKVINEDDYTISYENKDVVGCMDKDAYKLQQADTIEQLCDELIIYDEENWTREFITIDFYNKTY